MPTAPTPRTAAEVRSTAARLRARAKAARRIANDLGSELESFKPQLRAGARVCDGLATALEQVADEQTL